MTAPSYDANQVTTDGPFTAPRKWLHFLNVLIGVFVYAIVRAVLVGFGVPLYVAALIGGPGTFLVSRVKEWIRPTDPTHYTTVQHVADAMTDLACFSACNVLFLLEVGDRLAAFVVAIVLWLGYRFFRQEARP